MVRPVELGPGVFSESGLHLLLELAASLQDAGKLVLVGKGIFVFIDVDFGTASCRTVVPVPCGFNLRVVVVETEVGYGVGPVPIIARILRVHLNLNYKL
jgi:hypothetical protein